MTGKTISHYRILEKLGEGGMGVVYKAEDMELGRLVALKFLAEGPAKDEGFRARFRREAHAAARLDHPNICPVYGLEEAAGRMFMVMAFVDGPSLERRIAAGLPLGEALDHAIGVAQGLKEAHERGVVHRDIKAANVVLTSQGVPRITDFGLAKVEDRSRLTRAGTVMGTVSSMSPEQLRGEDADRRADVWSFGVLLYEMVTGVKPFQRADAHATTQAILAQRQTPPSAVDRTLPAGLDQLIDKALAKKREERYQHFDDLIVDLRAIRRKLSAEQASSVKKGESAEDAPTLTQGRWRWPFWIVAMLLVCAARLGAAYSNLIPTSDGAAVYFEVQTSLRNTAWFKAERTGVTGIDRPLGDASEDGATLASTSFGERFCGFAGSTCWTAPPCGATFVIDGPAGRLERYGRKTLARLSRDGRKAWIEQSTECRGLGTPVSGELQGLYEVPGLRWIAPAGGLTLASKRAGRRLITSRDQVLAQAANTQLHLVDQTGARPIRHQYAATEAVVDAEGRNIVYTDGSPGRMLWIDLAGRTEEEIGFGAAPTLSDDGKLLAFLSPEGALFLYRRETRELTRVAERALDFALAAGGRFLFVVTGENRLERIDIETGGADTWLEPFPEIRDAYPEPVSDPAACPLICYSPPEPTLPLAPQGYVVLGGEFWRAGWRARLADIEIPLQVPFREAVWFQVPAAAPAGRQPLVIFHPDHPIPFSATAQVAAPPVY